MATDDYEDDEPRGSSSRGSRGRSSSSSSSSSRSSRGGSGDAWRAVTSSLSGTAIIDIVERLGLVDMVVDRLKQRLEDVDVDELVDEVADYLKRNPEVLVVSLGAVTIAAGALVYLNRRKDGGRDRAPRTPAPSTGAAKRRATT